MRRARARCSSECLRRAESTALRMIAQLTTRNIRSARRYTRMYPNVMSPRLFMALTVAPVANPLSISPERSCYSIARRFTARCGVSRTSCARGRDGTGERRPRSFPLEEDCRLNVVAGLLSSAHKSLVECSPNLVKTAKVENSMTLSTNRLFSVSWNRMEAMTRVKIERPARSGEVLGDYFVARAVTDA